MSLGQNEAAVSQRRENALPLPDGRMAGQVRKDRLKSKQSAKPYAFRHFGTNGLSDTGEM
jgi:hypothetical protein